MMQRHDRLHACRAYSFDHLLVMSKGLVIELAGRWFESRPGKREAKYLAAEVSRQINIFGVTVPDLGGSPMCCQLAMLFRNIANIFVARVVCRALEVHG